MWKIEECCLYSDSSFGLESGRERCAFRDNAAWLVVSTMRCRVVIVSSGEEEKGCSPLDDSTSGEVNGCRAERTVGGKTFFPPASAADIVRHSAVQYYLMA